jgi:hypothetical protein
MVSNALRLLSSVPRRAWRAAQYRATFTEDLKQDAGDAARFKDDLRSLKEQGLIAERTVTRLREGAVADVVSVTPSGKALLDHHRDPEHGSGQVYYSGWVKPGEVWHDATCFGWCARSKPSSNSRGVVCSAWSWTTS